MWRQLHRNRAAKRALHRQHRHEAIGRPAPQSDSALQERRVDLDRCTSRNLQHESASYRKQSEIDVRTLPQRLGPLRFQ